LGLAKQLSLLERATCEQGEACCHAEAKAHPNKVFIALVYPEGEARDLTLKGFSPADFSDEDIKRIRIRYKKLMEDKTHAM
jgi:hypothetical protein